MARKEVSNCLEQIKNIILNSDSWCGEAKIVVEKCFNTAVKSLEAWEKVKEEIKYHTDNIKYTDTYRNGFEVSLKIIEKHLTEVEEMTREEAIADIRDNIKPVVGGTSLDMAIEALEQQPCDDCISRQAVLDAIVKYANMVWEKYREPFPESTILELIQSLPSVTPKEKTGKWINEKWYGLDFIGVTCSNCGIIESRFSAYCPNCGVKMVKSQESEDTDGNS